jgi:pimeloyl-ACP methyl ester carboxylesterase
MPTLDVNGAALRYEERGGGRESVVFAHGLLFDGTMFAAQVEALARRYRCVTFDFRGQGGSEVTRSGYDVETLTADAAGLIAGLGCAPCHFVGLSMGGFVGLRLALRRPELLRSLALLETSAEPESAANRRRYRRMAFVARWLGVGLVVDRVLPILFGAEFLHDPARADERARWRARLLGVDRVGMARAARGVFGRAGVEDELGRIAIPTLVVVGDQDVATPPARAERIHAGIPGARLVVVPGAGHSSPIEQPAAVTAALTRFLDEVARSRT